MTPDRRTTLRWAAAVAVAAGTGFGGVRYFGRDRAGGSVEADVRGYGKDPPLTSPHRDVWPLRLAPDHRAAVRQLADLILPGDPDGTPPAPAASALDIDAFFAEWLSAPYPDQRADRALLMPLLAAVAAATARTAAIRREPRFEVAAARFRVLATAAYYTTAEGLAAIGFVGNEARERFDPPPPAVVQRLEAAFARLKP